jgi:undecaprenyl-phosphate 4-deoxy-4-formamido-L-arabinose transferase
MSALVVREVTRYRGPYPYVDGLIMQITHRVRSLDVQHSARTEGRSNYTLPRLMRVLLNLATNFSVLPLRLAVLTGAAMGVLGVVAALFVIAEGLSGNPPSGWASLMAVALLIASAQFVMLGLLGEYVGRAFLTANGKPQGVVREVVRPPEERAARAERGERGERAAPEVAAVRGVRAAS